MKRAVSTPLIAFGAALLGATSAGLAQPAAPRSLAMEVAESSPEVAVDSWIVQTAPDMAEADIARVADAVLDDIESVEPLFPGDKDLNDIYIIQAARPVDQRTAFDVKYALLALPEFTDAAPNFPSHIPYSRRHALTGCGSDLPDPVERGWSLAQINAAQAWALDVPEGGRRYGAGVKICQPDTGWADHSDLDRAGLDLTADRDIIEEDDTALDPLDYPGSPGHGTATGSVLMSRGGIDRDGNTTPPGEVTGAAPEAVIIPIRAIRSVVQFLDSDVARAVNYARRQDCDVISMSLGGAGFFALEKVVNRAVKNNDKIVVAAAGNCVSFVVAPANYSSTIAVAASNIDGKPWKNSSHGPAVTVTAPGERVWVARRGSGRPDLMRVETSDGTSFATTAVAAAAADWIAFHGRAELNRAKGPHALADLFRFALVRSAKPGPGWDTGQYGAGILDLEALLETSITDFPADQPVAGIAADDALTRLARILGRPNRDVAWLLQERFGPGDPVELAVMFGPELQRIAVTEPDVVQTLLERTNVGASVQALGEDVTSRFSSRLRTALRR